MKANKLNKIFLAAAISSMLVTTPSRADTENMSFSFRTIPDVSIELVQDMLFGNDFALAVSSACTMVVSVAGGPSNITSRTGAGALAPAGATYQDLSGDCDAGAKGTAGIYRIVGAKGVDVDITVNAIPAGGVDFSFAPEGVFVDYTAGADNDTLTALTASGANRIGTATLATDSDTVNTSGSPIAGNSLIFVGGTITAQNTLTAGQPYTEQFTIDVTY